MTTAINHVASGASARRYTLTSQLTPIQRANRLRWAALELEARARELVAAGSITRGFRVSHAANRCHQLAGRIIRSLAAPAL